MRHSSINALNGMDGQTEAGDETSRVLAEAATFSTAVTRRPPVCYPRRDLRKALTRHVDANRDKIANVASPRAH